MFSRYAIYVTPDGPLGDQGAAWLGWDAARGRPVPQPEIPGLDLPKATARPRKYGFHGTIKPPFRLAPGTTPEGLEAALEALCAKAAPVALDGLEVARLGGFLALTPTGAAAPQDALSALAAQVVRDLDPFRAPLTGAEIARRRARPLSPTQEANLHRWGYPRVMEEFRFHLTLTGPLRDARGTLPIVAAHFAPVLPRPFVIDALTLLGEDAEGRFHQITRCALRG